MCCETAHWIQHAAMGCCTCACPRGHEVTRPWLLWMLSYHPFPAWKAGIRHSGFTMVYHYFIYISTFMADTSDTLSILDSLDGFSCPFLRGLEATQPFLIRHQGTLPLLRRRLQTKSARNLAKCLVDFPGLKKKRNIETGMGWKSVDSIHFNIFQYQTNLSLDDIGWFLSLGGRN